MNNNHSEDKLKRFLNSEIFLFFKDLLTIAIIVIFIRLFIAVPFQISGSSMADSYYEKEFIIVDRFSYIIGNPKRGDVIVFKPHVNQNKEYFLKRIIGIPGDKLKIENGFVFIQKKGTDKYIKIDESSYLNKQNNGNTLPGNSSRGNIFELGEDQYFVIGDNRNHSTDSRECFAKCGIRDEFVSKGDIIGKVFIDLGYFNFSKMKFITPTGVDSSPKFFNTKSTHDYPELK